MPGDPKGYQRIRAMITAWLVTGSGTEIEMGPWEGDLTIQGLEEGYKAPVVLTDRGTYKGSCEGEDVYPTWSLTLRHCGLLTSAGERTIKDTILKKGKVLADGDVTTDMEGRVWHLAVRMTVSAADGTDNVRMPNNRIKLDYGSGEKNTLALSGTCYRDSTGGDPVQFS